MTALRTETELTAALVERGVLAGTAEAPPAAAADRPWFVSAVLGAAGWLAGVCVLVFVYLLFEPDSWADFAVAGAVLVAAAYALYRVDRHASFLDQLALALSIAGQLALGAAFAVGTDSAAATAAFVALLQLVLLLVLPNALARALAAFFACVAWALTVRLTWWQDSFFDLRAESVALVPALLGWLAIWTPIAVAAEWLVRHERRWLATPLRRVARPASSGVIAALAVATWASAPFASLPFAPAAAGVNWLALWPLLATALALYAAACALRLRNRALLGLAVAGALLHCTQFYYVLGVSLLAKSALMLAVGAASLTAAWALRSGLASAPGEQR